MVTDIWDEEAILDEQMDQEMNSGDGERPPEVSDVVKARCP